MPALASIPSAIQDNPGNFNINPDDLFDFRQAVTDERGPIDYDQTPTNVHPGANAYDDGANRLETSENDFRKLDNQSEDLILVDDAARGHGNWRDNVILGNEDDNNLHGRNGDDTILGSGGNDKMFGNNGDDSLVGGSGNDFIAGNNGADTIEGGSGDDTIHGGASADADSIDGGSGNDMIWGNGGEDTLRGGDDNDRLSGGARDDELFGDAGEDTLIGGFQNDLLDGGADDDTLKGGAGDDTLIGGEGDDFVNVGAPNKGADVFIWNEGDGNDLVVGLGDNDLVDLTGAGDYTIEVDGNDTLIKSGGDTTRLENVQIEDPDDDDIWTIT